MPTYYLYTHVTLEFVQSYSHWFNYLQPSPMPENMLLAQRDAASRPATSPAQLEYRRRNGTPEGVHAMCEDYRAGASIDLQHDAADLDSRIRCPLHVLWAADGAMDRLYDVLAIWRERGRERQRQGHAGRAQHAGRRARTRCSPSCVRFYMLSAGESDMSRPLPKIVITGALLVGAQIASGHHSVSSNFDMSKMIEVRGTVAAVHIRNPHSQFALDVAAADGTTQQWLIEWSDRNSLIRRKVDIDRIKEGDELTITAWPSRRLEHVAYFVRAILPDGSTFRDCGFGEFREAVAQSREFSCPDAQGGP